MTKRRVDGVLLLDKPVGMTSNSALQKAKRLYQASKAGHTGTLDPFASGLLPICLGEATKFSQSMLDADKVYRATVRLGVRTATGDPEGAVLETRPVRVAEADVRGILPRFTGELLQTPPMHSALKVAGRPLYDYARKGVEIQRQPRPVRVYRLELVDFRGDAFTLLVESGKGLYVRTLAEDLGEALGCGAHLQALVRLAVGPLRLEQAVGLEELEALNMQTRDARLLPVDAMLMGLPRLILDPESAWQLGHGQAIWRAGLEVGDRLRAYGPDGRFIGLVEVDAEGRLAPKRLTALDTGAGA
jgi:tRNA pseudouridine55 synthase